MILFFVILFITNINHFIIRNSKCKNNKETEEAYNEETNEADLYTQPPSPVTEDKESRRRPVTCPLPQKTRKKKAANTPHSSSRTEPIQPSILSVRNGSGMWESKTCEECGNIPTSHRCMHKVSNGDYYEVCAITKKNGTPFCGKYICPLCSIKRHSPDGIITCANHQKSRMDTIHFTS